MQPQQEAEYRLNISVTMATWPQVSIDLTLQTQFRAAVRRAVVATLPQVLGLPVLRARLADASGSSTASTHPSSVVLTIAVTVAADDLPAHLQLIQALADVQQASLGAPQLLDYFTPAFLATYEIDRALCVAIVNANGSAADGSSSCPQVDIASTLPPSPPPPSRPPSSPPPLSPSGGSGGLFPGVIAAAILIPVLLALCVGLMWMLVATAQPMRRVCEVDVHLPINVELITFNKDVFGLFSDEARAAMASRVGGGLRKEDIHITGIQPIPRDIYDGAASSVTFRVEVPGVLRPRSATLNWLMGCQSIDPGQLWLVFEYTFLESWTPKAKRVDVPPAAEPAEVTLDVLHDEEADDDGGYCIDNSAGSGMDLATDVCEPELGPSRMHSAFSPPIVRIDMCSHRDSNAVASPLASTSRNVLRASQFSVQAQGVVASPLNSSSQDPSSFHSPRRTPSYTERYLQP